jgi:hypothetical protein
LSILVHFCPFLSIFLRTFGYILLYSQVVDQRCPGGAVLYVALYYKSYFIVYIANFTIHTLLYSQVVDWRCPDGAVVSDHLGLHFRLPPPK